MSNTTATPKCTEVCDAHAERGMRRRSVVTGTPRLAQAERGGYLDYGDELQVDSVPGRLFIADRGSALVPLDAADSSKGALLVRTLAPSRCSPPRSKRSWRRPAR